MWLMISVTLLVTVDAAAYIKQCPEGCRCNEVRRITYCNERSLKYVPTGISLDTRILHLQGNNILNSPSSEENLRRLQNLKRLDLHQNKLSFFPKRLPSSLERLLMQKNCIKFIGRYAFSGLPELIELRLDFNNISNDGIASKAFLQAQSLQDLAMAGNWLTSIPNNLPSSVKRLRLDHNRISTISKSSLSSLTGLLSLDLSHNHVRSIEIGALDLLFSLHTINLANNRLEEVPKSFPSKLEVLILSRNQIKYIRAADIFSLVNIIKLDLSSNQFESVEHNAFDGMGRLRDVELHDNPWRCDCYLKYLKTWLTNTTSVISSKGNIQCHTPEVFREVTIRSIDLEALQCRGYHGGQISFTNVESTSVNVFYKKSNLAPPYVNYKIVYGITENQNLIAATALPPYSPIGMMNTSNVLDIGVSSNMSPLSPNSHYLVCVFDDFYQNQVVMDWCADLMTAQEVSETPSERSTGVPTWSISLLCLMTLMIVTICVAWFVQKKRHRLQKTSINKYRNSCLYASTNTLDARQEFEVTIQPHRKVTTKPSVSNNITNLGRTDYGPTTNVIRNQARRPKSHYELGNNFRSASERSEHPYLWHSLRRNNSGNTALFSL